MPEQSNDRGQWKSRIGFILAASGSAIGLGNIVFFSANAYGFGGGAFYLPYLFALFVIGIPVMIVEFALGNSTGLAFPGALRAIAGKKGEFIGWWANINCAFLTMYYITILSWVMGMFFGAFGTLWQSSIPVPAFGMEGGVLPGPTAFFFDMLSTWKPLMFVAIMWVLNVIVIRRGAETIEPVTRVFVPLMWIFMIVLIVRGLTLPNGGQGLYLLFTPDFNVMKDPAVWQGAFSQIFFTLSLGLGTMTAYASYLPKKTDLTQSAYVTSLLNCGFEYIAGLAIFSILFAFAIVPRASTLSMTFFIIPQGIGSLPAGAALFGVLFFLLLLMAGLTSSVSLVETVVSALRDKFGWTRKRTVVYAAVVGFIGSAAFALPQVVNPGLENDGTLGLTLLDLVDHWVFSYGLLTVGLAMTVVVGWKMDARRLREYVNANSTMQIGKWFDLLLKYFIPGILLFILVMALRADFVGGLYGSSYGPNYSDGFSWMRAMPIVIFVLWLVSTFGIAALITFRGARNE